MATPLPAPVAAKAVVHAATVHDVVAQSATAANLNVYIVAAIITATAVIVSQLLNAVISSLREYRSRIRHEGRVKQVFISLVLEIDRLLSMVVNDRLLVDPEQVETQSQALREALADLTPLLDLDPIAIHSLYTLVGSMTGRSEHYGRDLHTRDHSKRNLKAPQLGTSGNGSLPGHVTPTHNRCRMHSKLWVRSIIFHPMLSRVEMPVPRRVIVPTRISGSTDRRSDRIDVTRATSSAVQNLDSVPNMMRYSL